MTKASWTLSSSSNMWKIYDQKHYVHDRSRKMFEIYDSKYMTIMFMNIIYVIKYMTNIWPNKLREHYLDNGISEFWWTLYCFWIGEKKYILGTHWWEKIVYIFVHEQISNLDGSFMTVQPFTTVFYRSKVVIFVEKKKRCLIRSVLWFSRSCLDR